MNISDIYISDVIGVICDPGDLGDFCLDDVSDLPRQKPSSLWATPSMPG